LLAMSVKRYVSPVAVLKLASEITMCNTVGNELEVYREPAKRKFYLWWVAALIFVLSMLCGCLVCALRLGLRPSQRTRSRTKAVQTEPEKCEVAVQATEDETKTANTATLRKGRSSPLCTKEVLLECANRGHSMRQGSNQHTQFITCLECYHHYNYEAKEKDVMKEVEEVMIRNRSSSSGPRSPSRSAKPSRSR
jgi:hypothetical protein